MTNNKLLWRLDLGVLYKQKGNLFEIAFEVFLFWKLS